MDKITAETIRDALRGSYPDAQCALAYNTPYQLLVATVLSAQCTDNRVNIVTSKLFELYGTPQLMLQLSQQQLEQLIHSCGFYHAKAKNILSLTKTLVEQYNGEVPADKLLLQKLSGVGRKTANVVCSVAFGIPGIAVDTHVFRVANRIGLATAKDELSCEKQLMSLFDEADWSNVHHLLIWHGRLVCHARKPDCQACKIKKYCRENGKIQCLQTAQKSI